FEISVFGGNIAAAVSAFVSRTGQETVVVMTCPGYCSVSKSLRQRKRGRRVEHHLFYFRCPDHNHFPRWHCIDQGGQYFFAVGIICSGRVLAEVGRVIPFAPSPNETGLCASD